MDPKSDRFSTVSAWLMTSGCVTTLEYASYTRSLNSMTADAKLTTARSPLCARAGLQLKHAGTARGKVIRPLKKRSFGKCLRRLGTPLLNFFIRQRAVTHDVNVHGAHSL